MGFTLSINCVVANSLLLSRLWRRYEYQSQLVDPPRSAVNLFVFQLCCAWIDLTARSEQSRHVDESVWTYSPGKVILIRKMFVPARPHRFWWVGYASHHHDLFYICIVVSDLVLVDG